MTVKRAKNGKALEYFTIKIEGGFDVDELAYLILGWENDLEKIKKIKSYTKLIAMAKKQFMDRGFVFLEFPTEYLESLYADQSVEDVHKQVMEHLKAIEPTKTLGTNI